jgi:DMSO reductase family type II enzyme chaperone
MARSALYRFFSVACAYPTAARFQTLREEALPAARAAASIAARKLVPGLEALFPYLDDLALEGLQSQYHRAVGHLPLPDCPPYEAGYLGGAAFREEHVLADIAGFYRAFGLLVGQGERERPDHVTVELEFMRVLTVKEAYALVHNGREKADICRRAQRRFWRDHLGPWLPSFGLLVARRAPDGFYKELGSSLATFAATENRVLGETITRPQPSLEPALGFADMDCSVAGSVACPLEGVGERVTN